MYVCVCIVCLEKFKMGGKYFPFRLGDTLVLYKIYILTRHLWFFGGLKGGLGKQLSSCLGHYRMQGEGDDPIRPFYNKVSTHFTQFVCGHPSH